MSPKISLDLIQRNDVYEVVTLAEVRWLRLDDVSNVASPILPRRSEQDVVY